jgi:hypothetical protein
MPGAAWAAGIIDELVNEPTRLMPRTTALASMTAAFMAHSSVADHVAVPPSPSAAATMEDCGAAGGACGRASNAVSSLTAMIGLLASAMRTISTGCGGAGSARRFFTNNDDGWRSAGDLLSHMP